jgi:hypothetical protein
MKSVPFPVIWLPAAIVLGWVGCAIPWGEPDGFHGTGIPFAIVLWDEPKGSDCFLDRPNPLAIIENPPLVYLVGILIWGAFRGVRFLITRPARTQTTKPN